MGNDTIKDEHDAAFFLFVIFSDHPWDRQEHYIRSERACKGAERKSLS